MLTAIAPLFTDIAKLLTDDGEWYEGKRHGFGKFYFQDGTMLKRMWEDGKMLEE